MPISDYMRKLREKWGKALVLCPGVAAVIRDDKGRVLLQRRAEDGEWSLPAGAVDPGEAPAQAVIREVWEETGLKVVPERVLGVFGGAKGFRFTYRNGDVSEYTVILFECRAVDGHLECRDGESLELRYFAPEHIPVLHAAYPRELIASVDGSVAYFEWDERWLDRLE